MTSTAGWARSNGDLQSELKVISEKIRSLDKKNTEQHDSLGKLEHQLETLDRDIANTAKSRQALQQELKKEQGNLASITQQQQLTRQSLLNHQKLLAGHSRALHRLSHKPGHQLLSPDNIQLSGRQQVWSGYLQRARQQAIAAVGIEHKALASLVTDQQQTIEHLNKLESDIQQQASKLDTKRKQRQSTATKLSTQLKSTQGQIAQLQQNQSKLNKILTELRKSLADPAFSVQGKTAFSRLKGKLPWPLKGKFTSNTDDRGLHIKAAVGQPVYAISHGRVVYADWLRGFGLLTIVDHGEGYMSLYGHNESLFKEVGDWVNPKTVIGNTGRSGGRSKSGLYFELRHNSSTLSVKKWCKNTG